MNQFECKTKDADGNTVLKTINAENDTEVMAILHQEGLTPIQIVAILEDSASDRHAARKKQTRPSAQAKGEKVKRKELLRFTMQLLSTVEAGVPIIGSLAAINEQSSSEALKNILTQMTVDLESGMSLSQSMAKHPRAFPEVYVNTIAAGERSGNIEEVLAQLADFLEGEIEVRSDIRSALMYPAITLCVLTIAVAVLVLFVVPKFATFYSKFGSDLPLPTRILVGASSFTTNYFPIALLALAGFIYGTIQFLRNPAGRLWADRMILKVPIAGRLTETASTLRLSQMLGLFTRAGFPLLEGLELISRTASNHKMRQDMIHVADGVATGMTLAASMEAAECFPPTVRQMIASGEITGSIDRACAAVAKHYRADLKYQTKNLATAIEPIVTVLLAGMVLFVALAAFLPMWNMISLMRQ